MSRLIDADVLLQKYGGIIYREDIKAMSTAYDTDKVVERLESERYVVGVNATIDSVTSADYIEGFNDCLDKVITEVKGAVRDE